MATKRQDYLRAIDLAKRSGLLRAPIEAAATRDEADLLLALTGCFSDLGQHAEAEAMIEQLFAAAKETHDETLYLRTVVLQNDVRFYSKGAAAMDEEALRRLQT